MMKRELIVKIILKKTRNRDSPEDDDDDDDETKANCRDNVKKTHALDRSKNDDEMSKRDAGCCIKN